MAAGTWRNPSPRLSYRLTTSLFCRRRSWVAAAQGEAARPGGDRPPPAGGAQQPAPAGCAQPSWLSNPAIAQRECMRQYYLASDTTDMLSIVDRSSNVLDVNTTLALFSYTAEARLKGQLQGGSEELISTLYAAVADQVPSLKPVQLGTLLWSLASVDAPSALTDGVVQRVAAQELVAGPERLRSYATRELCSIIQAYGKLARQRSPEAREYITALVAELVRRIQDAPYVRGELGAGDCAELAIACCAIYSPASLTGNVDGGGSSGNAEQGVVSTTAGSAPSARPGRPPSAATELLDELAHSVRSQLANKHSLRSPFTPRELIAFLGSYAALEHRSPKVSGMLDAAAGFVVRRIRSRHLNAVSRPEDLASLLHAFAALGHNSVAVPELLAAVGEQVCRNAAQQLERDAGPAPSMPASSSAADGASRAAPGAPSPAASGPPRLAGPDPGATTIPVVTALLDAYEELGWEPSPVMLQALAPGISRQLSAASPAQVLRLLGCFERLGYSPGGAVLRLMQARLAEAGGGGDGGGKAGVSGSAAGSRPGLGRPACVEQPGSELEERPQ